MPVKATILVDNYAFGRNGVLAQHGWSVLLETEHGSFLLDTGAGGALLGNASALGLDLHALQGIILSHHHHDHTGGLRELLATLKRPVPVYAHPDLFKASYSLRNQPPSPSGIPFRRDVLEGMGARFDLSDAFRAIAPGLFLTGVIPRHTAYEQGDPQLVVGQAPDWTPDPLDDDLAVILPTPDGLFVVLGCAHAGIVNTLRHAMARTGEQRIHTVFGGTHLGMLDAAQRDASLQDLARMDIGHIGGSHCTGMRAAAQMAAAWGDRFSFCQVGQVFTA